MGETQQTPEDQALKLVHDALENLLTATQAAQKLLKSAEIKKALQFKRSQRGSTRSSKAPPKTPVPPGHKVPDLKKRQRIHILMGKHIKDAKVRKQAFLELSGKERGSLLTELELSRLTSAFERMGEGKVNELRIVNGRHTIYEKPTGNTIFPVEDLPEVEAPPSPEQAKTDEVAPPSDPEDMF